jgi:hypothetical protein
MKTAILRRVVESGAGTFGVLIIDGLPCCVTLEHPWQHNEQNISCIPPGNYTLKRYESEVHGSTWQIQPVPGRGTILFHGGNTLLDSKGCVIVGSSYGTIGTHYGVRKSRDAMERLRIILGDADLIPLTVAGV